MKANVLSVQIQPVINDREKNFKLIKELVLPYKKENLDLILLPEFFSTGISNFSEYFEVENSSFSIEFFSRLAKEFNTNICMGTIIEKEGENFYNTMYVLNRDGEIVSKYRKIHLFSYLGGNEDEIITPGDCVVVSELDFAKVGLSICFDIRFPLHFNKLIKAGAEIIVCPNAWCAPSNMSEKIIQTKKEEIKSFIISRASENLVGFIGSSLGGKIGCNLVSCANSMIVSPDAEILAMAQKDDEAVFAKIDLNVIRNYKKTFPVYKID